MIQNYSLTCYMYGHFQEIKHIRSFLNSEHRFHTTEYLKLVLLVSATL